MRPGPAAGAKAPRVHANQPRTPRRTRAHTRDRGAREDDLLDPVGTHMQLQCTYRTESKSTPRCIQGSVSRSLNDPGTAAPAQSSHPRPPSSTRATIAPSTPPRASGRLPRFHPECACASRGGRRTPRLEVAIFRDDLLGSARFPIAPRRARARPRRSSWWTRPRPRRLDRIGHAPFCS